MNALVSRWMLPRCARALFTAVLLGSVLFAPPARATFGSSGGSAAKPDVYSGQAIGVRIDGVVNPPGLNPIVIAETDSLPAKGGVKAATKNKVAIGGSGLTVATAGSLTTGLLNECVSASALTNFHAEFVTEDGDHLTIEADYIGASAVAGGRKEGAMDTDAKVLIRGLKINGTPIAVTGKPNQLVTVGESRIYLNEQATSVDKKNADVSVAAIHFYTCECIEGWLARVHAGFTLGDTPERAPDRGPDCGR
jgi:hypothetical protein